MRKMNGITKFIIDLFYTKTYQQEPNKNKNPPRYIFLFYFHNKCLDFIHINKISKNEEVAIKTSKQHAKW